MTPQYDSTAANPLMQLRHYSTEAMFEGWVQLLSFPPRPCLVLIYLFF